MDLRYIPDGMTFDDEPRYVFFFLLLAFAMCVLKSFFLLSRDEANENPKIYKGLDFVTDVSPFPTIFLLNPNSKTHPVDLPRRFETRPSNSPGTTMLLPE